MIKRFVIPFIAVIVVGIQSCSVLEQAQEYERFIQCDFSIATVDVKEIAGIAIDDLESPDDLGIGQMMMITQQLFAGSFPAKIEIGLKAANHNSEQASVAGLEWIAMLKEEELLSGYVEDEVIVPPNGNTVFPVIAEVDLMNLLQSDSFRDIGDFVFSGDKKAELRDLGASLKIKPYYEVGGNIQKYPGYLTIEP
jgi:hypothetical protein